MPRREPPDPSSAEFYDHEATRVVLEVLGALTGFIVAVAAIAFFF